MRTVEVDCHLVIGQRVNTRGWADGKPAVRVAKAKPQLQAHEIVIALKLELPMALFVKPSLSARIVVPADQAPMEITPEIEQNIARAVQEQLGIVLRIEAPQPD